MVTFFTAIVAGAIWPDTSLPVLLSLIAFQAITDRL